jgi:hypothetical protein
VEIASAKDLCREEIPLKALKIKSYHKKTVILRIKLDDIDISNII